jgi:hypothetical protein
MKGKAFSWAVRIIVVLVLAAATGALAQDPPRVHLSGVINDYAPSAGPVPWEVRGPWSLRLKGESGKADFSAALTMELSSGASARMQHTHHITMEGTVSYDASDTSACPADSPPNTARFVINGMASTTANGNNAPFAPNGELSPLQVCIRGGIDVQYSNVTLVFSVPASTHFGPQAIHGVVRKLKES